MKKNDIPFCLVALPAQVVVDIDVVRDAIITYMPGYDEDDFHLLRLFLEWIENIDGAICVESNEEEEN